MHRDIFISYVDEDLSWAEWIGWNLEEEAFTVILQKWDSLPGRNWVADLDDGVQNTRLMLVVASAAYIGSPVARAQWAAVWPDQFTGPGIPIFPVLVEEVALTGLLRTYVGISLVGKDEPAAKSDLLAAVRGAERERAKPDGPPSFPTGRLGERSAPIPPEQRAVPARPAFPGIFAVPLGVNALPGLPVPPADEPSTNVPSTGEPAANGDLGGPGSGSDSSAAGLAGGHENVRSPRYPGLLRRRWAQAAAACGVMATAVAVGVFVLPGLGTADGPNVVGTSPVAGGSGTAKTGPEIVATISVPEDDDARELAVSADGAVWVANGSSNTVSRVDPASDKISDVLLVGKGAYAVAAGPDGVFAPGGDDASISLIDPGSVNVAATYSAGTNPLAVVNEAGILWVADDGGSQVIHMDSLTGAVLTRASVDSPANLVADADGGVWVGSFPPTGTGASKLSRISASGDLITSTTFPSPINALAAGDGVIWAATGDGIARVDPATGRVVTSVALPGHVRASDIAATAGGVWVVSRERSEIYLLDQQSNSLRTVVTVPGMTGGRSIAVSGSTIWVLMSGGTPPKAAIVRVNTSGDLDRSGATATTTEDPLARCPSSQQLIDILQKQRPDIASTFVNYSVRPVTCTRSRVTATINGPVQQATVIYTVTPTGLEIVSVSSPQDYAVQPTR